MKVRYFGVFTAGVAKNLPPHIPEKYRRKPKSLQLYEYVQWFMGIAVLIAAVSNTTFQTPKSIFIATFSYVTAALMLVGAILLAIESPLYKICNLAASFFLLLLCSYLVILPQRYWVLFGMSVIYLAYTLFAHLNFKARTFYVLATNPATEI